MFTTIADLLLLALAIVLAIPCSVFVLECLAAVLSGSKEPPLPEVDRPLRKAVMIPAHNEEVGLAATLRTVMPQLGEGDRCLVVADNCSDGTAEVALAHGASVGSPLAPHRPRQGLRARATASTSSPPTRLTS